MYLPSALSSNRHTVEIFLLLFFWPICNGQHRYRYSSGSAIAQWICRCLPFCGPGFESQAHHLCLFHLVKFCTLYVIILRKGPKTGRVRPIKSTIYSSGWKEKHEWEKRLNSGIFHNFCCQVKLFRYSHWIAATMNCLFKRPKINIQRGWGCLVLKKQPRVQGSNLSFRKLFRGSRSWNHKQILQ